MAKLRGWERCGQRQWGSPARSSLVEVNWEPWCRCCWSMGGVKYVQVVSIWGIHGESESLRVFG
jgi:hypothetical protein